MYIYWTNIFHQSAITEVKHTQQSQNTGTLCFSSYHFTIRCTKRLKYTCLMRVNITIELLGESSAYLCTWPCAELSPGQSHYSSSQAGAKQCEHGPDWLIPDCSFRSLTSSCSVNALSGRMVWPFWGVSYSVWSLFSSMFDFLKLSPYNNNSNKQAPDLGTSMLKTAVSALGCETENQMSQVIGLILVSEWVLY